MRELTLEFGHWLQNTGAGLAIGTSSWAFPYVQALHFCGLSMFVGTNVAVDLRLLGVGKGSHTPADLSNGLIVWNWIGFLIGITGGLLLFIANAETYVINSAFLTKLFFLIPLGLVLHIVVQLRAGEWSATPEVPKNGKIIGLIEMLVWVFVATAAVLIPYVE
jgi:hypothetical protein